MAPVKAIQYQSAGEESHLIPINLDVYIHKWCPIPGAWPPPLKSSFQSWKCHNEKVFPHTKGFWAKPCFEQEEL